MTGYTEGCVSRKWAIAGQAQWYLEAQLVKFKNGVRGAHPDDMEGSRMRPMARTLPTDAIPSPANIADDASGTLNTVTVTDVGLYVTSNVAPRSL